MRRLLRRGEKKPSPFAFLKDYRRVVPYLRPHGAWRRRR
jgi:hypothetical protein